MGKVSFELSIGYQKKKKKKKKKLRTRSNVRAKIKYIDITSIWISLGKKWEGPDNDRTWDRKTEDRKR